MSARFAWVVGVGLAFGSLIANGAERRLDRMFDVSPGGTLIVESDGTDVVVEGGDSNRVVVHILVTGSEGTLDRLELEASQSSSNVTVTVRKPAARWFDWLWSSWSLGGEIRVEVPRSYNAELRTSGGNLSVTRIEGKAAGKTSGGDVHVADVHGPVTLRTSGGNVRAERLDGETRLETSGGSIDVIKVAGTLRTSTSGGGIHLQDIGGSVVAKTSSGDVVATAINGDAELDTSGGDIRAVVNGRIDAHTSGGSITLVLVGANRGISAHTSGGSIFLRLPKDTTATLSAKTSGGSVHSDLPVAATDATGKELHGAINGGGNAIEARTSGGDIRLQTHN
jgi:hypothetical protein